MKIIHILFSLILFSCVSTAVVIPTPAETKIMSTRQYEHSKDVVFKSAISLLHSEGFIIESTDIEIGLIKAYKRIELDKKTARRHLVWKGKGQDASIAKFVIYIDKLNNNLSDVKITIYNGAEMTQLGGFGTISNKYSEAMSYDAQIYSNWFNSLRAEIERRKAFESN